MWTLAYVQLQSQKNIFITIPISSVTFLWDFLPFIDTENLLGLINFLKIPVIDELSLYT